MNENEPSTSNQATQGDFDEPNGRQYEYVFKRTFTSPQPFNHDTSCNGSMRINQDESRELEEAGEYVILPNTEEENARNGDYVIKNPDIKERGTEPSPQIPQHDIPTCPEYEYPYLSQSHQFGCPSLNNNEADRRGKTNSCVQDSAYSPLARRPLNKNENDHGGPTSLIREERKSEKGDTTAKKDKGDELLQYVDVIDSYYTVTNSDGTPLVSETLKEHQSDNGRYTSLIREEATREKADTTAIKDNEDELLYVDVIDSHYTPLAKLNDNEREVPFYQPLLKNNQKELKEPTLRQKQKKK